MKRTRIFSFQWDHTPYLHIYEDGLVLGGTNDGGICKLDAFLNGAYHEEIIGHFGKEVLQDAIKAVRRHLDKK